MKGRPAKAIELHKQQGTFRPDRHQGQPIVIGGRTAPECPESLTGEMKDLWDLIVTDMAGTGLIDKADAIAIEAMVTFVSRARQARADIASLESYYIRSRNDALVIHPAIRLERDSFIAALRYAEQLGLSPSARARLGIAQIKGMSMAEELAAKIGKSPRTTKNEQR